MLNYALSVCVLFPLNSTDHTMYDYVSGTDLALLVRGTL